MPMPWARVSINQQPYKAPRVGDRRPEMPTHFQEILSGFASGMLQIGTSVSSIGSLALIGNLNYWFTPNVTVTTGQADPFGGFTAVQIADNATHGQHGVEAFYSTGAPGFVYSVTVCFEPGTYPNGISIAPDLSQRPGQSYLNCSNAGALTVVNGGPTTIFNQSVSSVGGFFEIQFQFSQTSPASQSNGIAIFMGANGSLYSGTGQTLTLSNITVIGTPAGFQTIRSVGAQPANLYVPWFVARSGSISLGPYDTVTQGANTYAINSSGQATVNGVVVSNGPFALTLLGSTLTFGAYATLWTYTIVNPGVYLLSADFNIVAVTAVPQGGNGAGPVMGVYQNGTATPIVGQDQIALTVVGQSDQANIQLLGELTCLAGDVITIRGGTFGTTNTTCSATAAFTPLLLQVA
jgi:hypothetical protein